MRRKARSFSPPVALVLGACADAAPKMGMNVTALRVLVALGILVAPPLGLFCYACAWYFNEPWA